MSIEVASWNMENAFGDERAPAALEIIKRLNADVLFVPETAEQKQQDTDWLAHATEVMKSEGYANHALSTYYATEDKRPNQHILSMWSRLPARIQRRSFGNRFGMHTYDKENGVSITGVHFDDASEALRTTAAEAFLNDTDGIHLASPALLMGDFNTMHRRSRAAKAYRLAGAIALHPKMEHHSQNESKLHLLASLAVRITEMADGGAIEILEAAGFRDLDQQYRPTIKHSFFRAQLDHIMINAGVEASCYQVHTQLPARIADHDPVSTKVHGT